MARGGGKSPSLALLAQDAFLRRTGIARYQTELVTRLAGRTNLHLLVVSPSHVRAAQGTLPDPMAKAVLHHYTNPAAILRNSLAIARGVLEHTEVLDWNPYVCLNSVSSRLFVGSCVDRAGFDLVHGTASYLPHTRGRTARIITIHDTTPLTMPQRHTPSTVKCFVRPSEIRSEDHVIADSKSGLGEILSMVDHPPERSHVIPLGVDRSVFHPPTADAPAVGEPYVLSVGTIEPRKNLERALDAFERLRASHTTLRWKIAGQRGWGWAEFKRALDASPARAAVDVLGATSDEGLGDLYRGARALLFPSLWEGFGFPVVEAMACGAPVAASKLKALDEVAGDAYVPLDPESVDSIVGAVERAAFDESARAPRRAAGLERAKGFDWARTAEKTLEVYAKALDRSVADLTAPPT